MEKLNPIGDRVVLKAIGPDEMTSGGVILPDIAQEETMLGTVCSVGPGEVLSSGQIGSMQCKVGDTVMYPKYGAKKIEVDGEDYLVIREKELLVIIKEK